MKMNAYVAGVGMTRFGKHLDITLERTGRRGYSRSPCRRRHRSVAILRWPTWATPPGGVVQGQEMISGQVALRELGIGKIPVINVENACATSSTAFNQACAMVTAGAYDVALVCGFEKLFHEDKMRSFAAFDGAVDTENPTGLWGHCNTLAAKAGEDSRYGERGQNTLCFHGHLFPDDPGSHERIRHHRGADCRCNRQELLPCQHQRQGPVPDTP